MTGDHRNDRQWIEQTTIDQHARALHDGAEQAGNGCRSAHGLMQAAFLEPDFLLIAQVGGYRREGNGQFLNADFTEDVANLAEDLFTANGAKAKAHIKQAQDVQIIKAFAPLAVLVEFSGRIDAADYCTH